MRRSLLLSALLLSAASAVHADVVDVADLSTQTGEFTRVHGSTGDGRFGVPVAGGFDVDADGANDSAFSAMRASPFDRSNAGEIYLVFGDGTLSGTLDTAVSQAGVLVITGAHARENAGSELWMDDVTGDGFGDLLIARQNHDEGERQGAGALTILIGGAEVATYADTLAPLDLAAPPASLTLTTLVGPTAGARLGIWLRTGDIDGDLISDIVVGADQEGSNHEGAAYVIRGGAHLAAGGTIDLANFGSTAIAGNLARLAPPALGALEHHMGATVQIGDLSGNKRGEVLVAATLNRAGAGLQSNEGGSHATGGSSAGTLYIVWDDNFGPDPWPAGYSFAVDDPPGTGSVIDGNADSDNFGEELLAGFDFDDDGNPDLFVGDLVGDASPGGDRFFSGHGYVFYHAAGLAGLDFDLGTPPPGLTSSLLLGAVAGNLFADTAAAGDFDGDGVDDLAVASPHFDALGRVSSGAFHVFFGKPGGWPATVDVKSLPDPSELRVTELLGAEGRSGSDLGDTLGYSAAAGFIDGDDKIDLIADEMMGDGFDGFPENVGTLVIFSGALLPEPGLPLLFAAALMALGWLSRRARI